MAPTDIDACWMFMKIKNSGREYSKADAGGTFSSSNSNMKDNLRSEQPRRFLLGKACMLLVIAGENTQIMVATMLQNSVL